MSRANAGLNADYMKIDRKLPEVDVPKGALVEVDMSENFSLSSSGNGVMTSVNVVCLDEPATSFPHHKDVRLLSTMTSPEDDKEAKVKLSVVFKVVKYIKSWKTLAKLVDLYL